MPRRRKEIIEMKEFIQTFRILPIYNDDYTEIIFFLCSCTQNIIRFKDFMFPITGKNHKTIKVIIL